MPYRAQSANRLTERIHVVVRSALDLAEVSRVIVACSGGADSTCLAHAVAAVALKTGAQVTICHVQHCVRADDDRDAAAVRALADDLQVGFRLVHLRVVDTELIHPRSEGAMRDLRYRALAMIAADEQADATLTGHTLDDQAETVLLHLVRGAGLDGLGGMGEETTLSFPDDLPSNSNNEAIQAGRRLRIIRPLLSVRHEETVAYCGVWNLATVHDPTNDDRAYARNWMRHVIVPALRARNPAIVSALAWTASLAREDTAFLAAEAERAMVGCAYRTDAACVSLLHAAFASQHVAIQRRMLRRLFEQVTGHVPRASDIDAARRHATTTRSSAIRVFGGVACALAFGRIVFGARSDVAGWVSRAAADRYPLADGAMIVQTDQTIHLSVGDHSLTHYTLTVAVVRQNGPAPDSNDRATVLLRLPPQHAPIIRNRLPRDRFWPVGRARGLPLSDYLAARGVPAPVRGRLPLLVVNDTIAWVIGHDVSVEFAATEATATHRCIVTRINTPANERIGANDG